MDLVYFSQRSDLVNKTELEKVLFLAFYYSQIEAKQDFSLIDISQWFNLLNFSKPNKSRLSTKINKSKWYPWKRKRIISDSSKILKRP